MQLEIDLEDMEAEEEWRKQKKAEMPRRKNLVIKERMKRAEKLLWLYVFR